MAAKEAIDTPRFWMTIKQIYRGEQKRLMSSLDLRRYAQAGALAYEMTSWDDNHNHRNIPEMLAFRHRWLDATVSDFMGSDNHRQLVDAGYKIGDSNDVRQRLYNLLLVPDSTQFYCLHCRNIVTITDDLLCPLCGGWYLLEMCPTDPTNTPKNPSRWDEVCIRLNPFPIYQEPPLSEDALVDVKAEDIIHVGTCICNICYEEFQNGNTTVQTTCGHLYHRDCIVKWLRKKAAKQRQCPICRQLMPTADAVFNIHLRIQAMKEKIRLT